MKTRSLLAVAFLATILPSHLKAQDGVVDLTTLDNYANQPIPPYILRNNTPPNNPITNAGATLGRVLFHDKRLSRNDTVSCSSCHVQSHAFSDLATASTGVSGTTGRHAMRLINARFSQEVRFFWDERATSLENQTTQPIKDHNEMGFSGTLGDPAFVNLVLKLAAIPEYRVLFAMTFGDPTIDEIRIQRTLSQFVRSIQSFDSRYDIGRATNPDGAPFPNFTASENAGKQLFLAPPGPGGGAGCAGCHRPPEFDIDPNSRNNGVTAAINGGTDLTNTRSPSLRDMVGPSGQSNGPFMHNGVFGSIAQVVNHYNAIPGNNANLDPRLQRPGGQVQNLNLTPQQKSDLEAFLRTLSGNAVYTNPKWSSPFSGAGALTLIVLPESAISIQKNGNGTATLTGHAAPNLAYQLQSSTDLHKWMTIATLVSDIKGDFSSLVPMGGPISYRFTFTAP